MNPETIFLTFMGVLVLVAVLPPRRVFVAVNEQQQQRATADHAEVVERLDAVIDLLTTSNALARETNALLAEPVVSEWEQGERAEPVVEQTQSFDADETIRLRR